MARLNSFIVRKQNAQGNYEFFSTLSYAGIDLELKDGFFRFANAAILSRDEAKLVLQMYPTAEQIQVG